jgi:hypothetical protein
MRAPPVCELAGTDPTWASCPRRHRPHLPYETCHGMMTRSPREARSLAAVFCVSLRVRVHLPAAALAVRTASLVCRRNVLTAEG